MKKISLNLKEILEHQQNRDPYLFIDYATEVIPGVSSTDTVLQNLSQLKLDKVILDFYNSGKPILCICVGMQILFERLEEGQIEGLGILKGEVKKQTKKTQKTVNHLRHVVSYEGGSVSTVKYENL